MSDLLLNFYQTVGLFKVLIFATYPIIIIFLCRGVRLKIVGLLSVFIASGLLIALDVQERRDFENLITQYELTISQREEVVRHQAIDVVEQHNDLRYLYWQAIQYDPKMADQFLAAYINISKPDQSQFFAARDASNVFIARWRHELRNANDSVFHLMAPDYRRIFEIMKSSDPQLCTTYLSGKWAFYGDAYFPKLRLIAKFYPNLSVPVEEMTHGSKEEALDFGVKTLGEARLKKLMAREGTFTEVCDELITIFEELESEQTPETAAAARFWMQPAKFYD